MFWRMWLATKTIGRNHLFSEQSWCHCETPLHQAYALKRHLQNGGKHSFLHYTSLTSQDSSFKTRGPQAGHTGGKKVILTVDIRNTIRVDEIKIPNLHYQPSHAFSVGEVNQKRGSAIEYFAKDMYYAFLCVILLLYWCLEKRVF